MEKQPMNLSQHLETFEDLRLAAYHISRAFYRCQNHFYKTSKLMRLFLKILPSQWLKGWSELKCELNSEYYKISGEEGFKKHGHLYDGVGADVGPKS